MPNETVSTALVAVHWKVVGHVNVRVEEARPQDVKLSRGEMLDMVVAGDIPPRMFTSVSTG